MYNSWKFNHEDEDIIVESILNATKDFEEEGGCQKLTKLYKLLIITGDSSYYPVIISNLKR
jgi:hypothetical protein